MRAKLAKKKPFIAALKEKLKDTEELCTEDIKDT